MGQVKSLQLTWMACLVLGWLMIGLMTPPVTRVSAQGPQPTPTPSPLDQEAEQLAQAAVQAQAQAKAAIAAAEAANQAALSAQTQAVQAHAAADQAHLKAQALDAQAAADLAAQADAAAKSAEDAARAAQLQADQAQANARQAQASAEQLQAAYQALLDQLHQTQTSNTTLQTQVKLQTEQIAAQRQTLETNASLFALGLAAASAAALLLLRQIRRWPTSREEPLPAASVTIDQKTGHTAPIVFGVNDQRLNQALEQLFEDEP